MGAARYILPRTAYLLAILSLPFAGRLLIRQIPQLHDEKIHVRGRENRTVYVLQASRNAESVSQLFAEMRRDLGRNNVFIMFVIMFDDTNTQYSGPDGIRAFRYSQSRSHEKTPCIAVQQN